MMSLLIFTPSNFDERDSKITMHQIFQQVLQQQNVNNSLQQSQQQQQPSRQVTFSPLSYSIRSYHPILPTLINCHHFLLPPLIVISPSSWRWCRVSATSLRVDGLPAASPSPPLTQSLSPTLNWSKPLPKLRPPERPPLPLPLR